MDRPAQTKSLANQIDGSYVRHRGTIRNARTGMTIAGVVVALAWLGYRGYPDPRVYNPGPVSSAHAMLEHDCAKCHQPAASGVGFVKKVSDGACLSCHDGAIHHPNQKELIAADRSANCVHCHVEHKGRPALAAMDDAHCTSCHAHLSDHVIEASPDTSHRNVTAFTLAAHPPFGRQLRDKNTGAMTKPTVLKFNHAMHLLGLSKDESERLRQCTTCHTLSQPNPLSPSTDSHLPPTALPADAPRPWGNDRSRAYMQPVSYARHCAACHPLNLPLSPAAVMHGDLAVVRTQLGGIRTLLEQAGEAAVDEALQAMDGEINDKNLLPPAHAATRPSTQPALLEYVVLRDKGVRNSCFKCHKIEGDPFTHLKDPAAPPARIAPTGITTSPRRWYPNSFFDHDAHRDQKCLSCHDSILAGEQDKDKWAKRREENPQEWEDAELAVTRRFNSPGIENCVACHRPDDASRRWAGANCISCHVYHDRTRDRLPATAPAPTSVPAVAAAAGNVTASP
jgi:hypothetical protein